MSKSSVLRAKKSNSQRRKQTQMQGLVLLLIALGFVVAGILISQDNEAAPEVLASRLTLDPVLGPKDAPVTIVEYGAYACTSCRQFHQLGIIDNLLAEYDGQVNFVFRDFPVISPAYDLRAAQVAQCALDQSEDGFWAIHDAFYRYARPGESTDELIGWGAAVGLDETALRQCVEAGTHRETVDYDLQRALELGLPGTPSFFINDQRVFAPSERALREAIDAALQS